MSTIKKIKSNTSSSEDSFTEIHIPDIGVGRYTTTATMILTTLLIEDSLIDRASVLESVIDHLGIEPEDFIKMRRNMDRWKNLDYDNNEKYSWE